MRDPRCALAETLSRIDSLLGEGRSRDDELDTERLSIESGVPQGVIGLLLAEKKPPVEDITDRIVRRIVHLRETRLRPDGTRHSYDEIAASYGASRASLSNLVNSRRSRNQTEPRMSQQQPERRPARSGGPLASTQAGIEKFFFGQPNGWLSAEPETALNNALQPVLSDLERHAANPAARLRNVHGLQRLAARGAEMTDDELELTFDWIDMLLKRRNTQGAQRTDMGSPNSDSH
ncbi:hypothetical protein ACFY93_09750 [Streptomyces sp. NPDC008313]|uniref:hypothetical protein n=1 Tax=Streptomyces sp. NPDC008313 TaxID=3364826 RepID=UPI0036F03452